MTDIEVSEDEILIDLVSHCPEVTGLEPNETNSSTIVKKISKWCQKWRSVLVILLSGLTKKVKILRCHHRRALGGGIHGGGDKSEGGGKHLDLWLDQQWDGAEPRFTPTLLRAFFSVLYRQLLCILSDSFVKEFRRQSSVLTFGEQCILLVNKIAEHAQHSKCSTAVHYVLITCSLRKCSFATCSCCCTFVFKTEPPHFMFTEKRRHVIRPKKSPSQQGSDLSSDAQMEYTHKTGKQRKNSFL